MQVNLVFPMNPNPFDPNISVKLAPSFHKRSIDEIVSI